MGCRQNVNEYMCTYAAYPKTTGETALLHNNKTIKHVLCARRKENVPNCGEKLSSSFSKFIGKACFQRERTRCSAAVRIN